MRDHYRSADGKPVLVLAKLALMSNVLSIDKAAFEVIGGVQFVVSEKFPERTVEAVRPRLNRGVKNSRARTTELRAEVRRLDFEFLDGIHRRQNDEIRTVQEVNGVGIVVDSVEHVVVLRRAVAISCKCA